MFKIQNYEPNSSHVSKAKVKGRTLVSQQIRDIFKDAKFENLTNNDEKQVWDTVC